MQNFIGKLGNNFLVAAFVPALWFVVSAQVLFSPIDPAGRESVLALPTNFFEGDGLITLILTLIIGFTIMGLNTFIYKLLEGYFVLEKVPFLRRRQYRKAIQRRLEFEWRDKLADRLFELNKNEHHAQQKQMRRKQILRLHQESRDLKAQYRQDYPAQIRGVLPTRFGNILKSSELYANENYGIDAVVTWPRLIYVMDPEYYKKVDESNNGLAFVINCMALSLLLSILCLFAAGYQLFTWDQARDYAVLQENNWAQETHQPEETFAYQEEVIFTIPLSVEPASQQLYRQRGWLYLTGSLLLVGLAFFFYYASLPMARQYGDMVRSTFDLFRFDLLTQLRLPLPPNDEDEQALWTLWSEFTALGQFEGSRPPFPYIHKDEGKVMSWPPIELDDAREEEEE